MTVLSGAVQLDAAIVHVNDLLVSSRYAGTLTAAGLVRSDNLFETRAGRVLDKPGLEGWRRRLRVQLMHGGAPQDFYLKQFVEPPRRARWNVRRSGSGARSVAGVEWAWMWELAAAAIPCPEPVALAESFVNGRETRSAILMRAVPGRSLERWAQESVTSGTSRGTVLTLMERTADLVARLHAEGLVHRDLYLSHFYWSNTDITGGGLSLIDLQRLFRTRWLRRRWIVKDLAALDYSTPRKLVSGPDRMRWLKRYLGMSKLGRSDKRLARAVSAKCRRLAAHDRRRRERWKSQDQPAQS